MQWRRNPEKAKRDTFSVKNNFFEVKVSVFTDNPEFYLVIRSNQESTSRFYFRLLLPNFM